MLSLILVLLLFWAITWVNVILVFFAVLYFGIKGINYVRNYIKQNNKSEYKNSGRVGFDDADFVEVVE